MSQMQQEFKIESKTFFIERFVEAGSLICEGVWRPLAISGDVYIHHYDLPVVYKKHIPAEL